MVRTMKNPLRKRHLRDLKQEIGKYLVIFLLLTASIGFVSGFLVVTRTEPPQAAAAAMKVPASIWSGMME